MEPTETKSKRRRNPQGEGGRLRGELIAAAARLLARTGDQASLTLRGVAREAEIAAPSVYLHFASKDDLIWAVLVDHFTELHRAITAESVTGADPAALLVARCLAYCEFGLERPGPYHILFGVRRQLPAGPDEPLPGTDTFAVLVDAIAACIEAGMAPSDDAYRLATNVWVALHGIVTLRQAMPGSPWPPLAEQVTDIIVGLVGIARRALPGRDPSGVPLIPNGT